MASTPEPMWTNTPLLKSYPISERLGANVFLKLDNLQRGSSFKYRGISYFVQKRLEQFSGQDVHFIIASGGNAGVALAQVASDLHLKCTVFIPEAAGKGGGGGLVRLLRDVLGARVEVGGGSYAEALERAIEFGEGREEVTCMVPAYDHHDLFVGHASMVREISGQLPLGITKPDAILCCVGGGGLLGGIIMGCKEVGWDDVPLVALETDGTNCFYQSYLFNKFNIPVEAGVIVTNDKDFGVSLARLPTIASRAGSLGAAVPSAECVKLALERGGRVICVSVPDELSMKAALSYADDHHFMAELSFSTTLVAAYVPDLLLQHILSPAPTPTSNGTHATPPPPNIVFISCGGVKVSLDDLAQYKSIIEASTPTVNVRIEGKSVEVGLS